MGTLNLDWRQYAVPGVDGLVVDVRPLEVWAYQKVLAAVASVNKADAREGETPEQHSARAAAEQLTRLTQTDIGALAKDVFAKHLRNPRGLTIRINGSERSVEIDDLHIHASLMMPAIFILAHLLTISVLTGAEEKNSSPPPIAS